MKGAEVITIGDELIFGQLTDLNSGWIAGELTAIGIDVIQFTSIRDVEDEILRALKESEQRADIILITGGLGPTKDDLTKPALCKHFRCGLKTDKESLKIIADLFQSRGIELTQLNREQADLPEKCTPVFNHVGTAPGMFFEENGKIYVSMPGVPYEMKAMMQKYVLPKLKKLLPAGQHIVHRHVMTTGIGESFLSEKISEWEDSLPKYMKLAYLPSRGTVRLRLTARGNDRKKLDEELDRQIGMLTPLIDDYIFGKDDDTLELVLGEMLLKKKQTVATAESCTGGNIAYRITNIPGSSEYYRGSVVAYETEVKIEVLGVDKRLIEEHGVVSARVAEEMAEGARRLLKSTYAISSTGVAGPEPLEGKPAGTVWIGLAGDGWKESHLLKLGDRREGVIASSTTHALNLLRKKLKSLDKGRS